MLKNKVCNWLSKINKLYFHNILFQLEIFIITESRARCSFYSYMRLFVIR